ncbi:MAG: ABC transporter ATP-binding protein [Treponema sp.]|jgi:oligopeptide/dipeptide ABC transporter ATP-binding protein|nr:ABC transporter ATP-binding protein [Treponema sp.]
MNERDEVLSIYKLFCDFMTTEGIVYALSGVNLDIRRGAIHGLVGESGCGKSVTGRAIMALHEPRHTRLSGEVRFDGQNLLALPERELRRIRGRRVSMIFQDPGASLSPLMPVGRQIAEAITNHFTLPKPELQSRVSALLEQVGLHSGVARQYPFELSGGMQQRVMIAQAIACKPELLIADEPTTALDVTIQAQVLNLLKELRTQLSLSVLLITHNFAVVAEVCDRVSVMYAGQIVETADAATLISAAAHPYSLALINCIPRGRGAGDISAEQTPLPVIAGSPPRLYERPRGCPFAPRCKRADTLCKTTPPLLDIDNDHKVRCHHAG